MKLFEQFFRKTETSSEAQITKDSIALQYDLIADQYSKHIDRQKLTSLYERPFMLEQLPKLQGLRVLDAGCGTGFYAQYAFKEGAHIIAVDSSTKLVGKFKKDNNSSIETHVADLSRGLPFIEENSIDVIICSLVLHYIEEWSLPLAEFKRVLKPGGMCLVSVHHPVFDTHFNKQQYFLKRLVHDKWDGFGNQPLNVSYYVRPLSDYLRPILASRWSSVEFEEPLPSKTLSETDPDMFRKLSEAPVFLFVKMIK
jgi:ubiquinone/menaquinone biosynthesis C-methylase UbiE